MSEKKRRISKCECCPFYAKEQESKKWECSRINRAYYQTETGTTIKYVHKEKYGICVFNYDTSNDKENEIRNQIIERWLKANEQIR